MVRKAKFVLLYPTQAKHFVAILRILKSPTRSKEMEASPRKFCCCSFWKFENAGSKKHQCFLEEEDQHPTQNQATQDSHLQPTGSNCRKRPDARGSENILFNKGWPI
jgi:hypothetical protein